jgi:hypothetical protein
MKAEDLMIGDWVLQCELNVPVKVRTIMCHYLDESIYFYHEASEYISNVSKLEPIPLTIEILEKIGYKFNYICYEKEGYPAIELGSEEGTYNIGRVYFPYNNGDPDIHVFTTCKYVHELQHALKLYGIKEEIIYNKRLLL